MPKLKPAQYVKHSTSIALWLAGFGIAMNISDIGLGAEYPINSVGPTTQSVSLYQVAQADDREREARRLFVGAARLTQSDACTKHAKSLSLLALAVDPAVIEALKKGGLISGMMGNEQLEIYISCLRHRRRAAEIHQRILSQYPDTLAAFHLASKPAKKPSELDEMIAVARSERNASEDRFAKLLEGLAPTDTKEPEPDTRETNELSRLEVRELQQLLTDLGFPSGEVDGLLGPRTIAAIGKFQTSRGIVINQSPSRELLELVRKAAKPRSSAPQKFTDGLIEGTQ